MAAPSRNPGVAGSIVRHGIRMPHLAVKAGHIGFAAAFLKLLSEESELDATDAPVTTVELAYIYQNTEFIHATVCCFSPMPADRDFPQCVSIPVKFIGPGAVNPKIIVVMCRFSCATTDVENCYYLGFKFADDLALRTLCPQNGEVGMDPLTLQSVHLLVKGLRARLAANAADHAVEATPIRDDGADSPALSSPPPTPSSLRESAAVILASVQPTRSTTSVPGPFIFCSLNVATSGALTSAVAYRDQVVWRARGRVLHYKLARGVAPSQNERYRLDCGLFSSASPNDFYHEVLVMITLVLVFKSRMDLLVTYEMDLMRTRLESKLTDGPMRTKFLEMNGLYDDYAMHQATCAHEKYECFGLFVLETYEATLRRLGVIFDYLLHDLPEAESRASDAETMALLEHFVDRVVEFMQDKF